MTTLSKSQQTRVRILRAIARDRTLSGCSAARTAKIARLHASTVRRHLADMRKSKEGLAAYLVFVESPKGCFTYRALPLPRFRLTKNVKRTKRTSAPVVTTKPVMRLQATPTPTASVSVRIFRALETPLGLHELGQALRVKRNVLQGTLDTLSGVTRVRLNGRWIYSRVS